MSTPFEPHDFAKSPASEPQQNCLEVAQNDDEAEFRDSKTVFGSASDQRIRVGRAVFLAFLNEVRGGPVA
jgi:hypothetical protein